MPDVLRTVGRYEVVRELGRGASGRLHLARRPDLDGLVALEELDSLGLDDETRELFLESNARRVFELDGDRPAPREHR